MGKRLFVGNLPFSTTADELRSLFSQHGTVTDVHIVMDRETARPRGFAFVSFETDEQAARATDVLNGRPLGGRPLVVKDARDRGAPAPPGERPPRPAGDRPPRPAGDRPPFGDRPPRPGGGFRGPGGPSSGDTAGGFRSFGPRPPRTPIAAPVELPPEGGERRRHQVPRKPRVSEESDRTPKARVTREEEAPKAAGWRQWLSEFDEEEDTDLLPDDNLDQEEQQEEQEEEDDQDQGR